MKEPCRKQVFFEDSDIGVYLITPDFAVEAKTGTDAITVYRRELYTLGDEVRCTYAVLVVVVRGEVVHVPAYCNCEEVANILTRLAEMLYNPNGSKKLKYVVEALAAAAENLRHGRFNKREYISQITKEGLSKKQLIDLGVVNKWS